MIKASGLFFLLLLKILGVVVLALLLLLLAVLLLVLFVPVRYHVFVQNGRGMPGQRNPAANLQVHVTVTWLFGLLHLLVCYGQKGLENSIRIAGIDIKKVLEKQKRKKENKKKAKRRKEQGQKRSKQEQGLTGLQACEASGAEAAGQVHGKAGTEAAGQPYELEQEPASPLGTQEQPATGQAPKESAEPEIEVEKASGHKKQKEQKKPQNQKRQKNKKKHPKGPSKSEKEAGAKDAQPGADGPDMFQKVRGQYSRIRGEFKDEANRHALGRLWKELLRLLKSYRPRKFQARLTFSLANPALTGEVVGILALLPFVYRYPCSILPDFTSGQLYIEGEIMAEGKVTLCVALLSALRLFGDKTCRQVARRLMGQDGVVQDP